MPADDAYNINLLIARALLIPSLATNRWYIGLLNILESTVWDIWFDNCPRPYLWRGGINYAGRIYTAYELQNKLYHTRDSQWRLPRVVTSRL